MKDQNKASNNKHVNGFIPNSLRFISSCIKNASSGVRSASASVAASISGDSPEFKDQVLCASFDRLELGPSSFRRVLLLGYTNGFQVLNVEEASNVSELVSRRDDPVTFLQMQPLPAESEGHEGFRASHPLLLVVASDESKSSGAMLNGRDGLVRDGYDEPQTGNIVVSPTVVRFYSIRSHTYVHVWRFRSTVYMVRCSPRVVAVGLAAQIYCFDALTLENKFSVLTYPVPQLGGQGVGGVNIGCGPMAVGPRWLAYAPNNPFLSNSGRLSPQSLTPSPGVSPSTSPGSGNLVARYAMESSKQLAAGLINLGDMSYRTLSKYYQDRAPNGSSPPVSSNLNWKVGRGASHMSETDIAGMVVVKDFVCGAVVSQFKAHTSPISALSFDPSGTLLVTASIHGNNINIFRIIPPCSKNGSGSQSYDWNSSHVHLYKLHRGMTSAVIYDICFSHYSQWVAIVSSHGTCHIFVLSPFGGENVLQINNSYVEGPTLLPVLSLPWWSSQSFMVNSQSLSLPSPPPPVTLSVVSRIKNNNTGWLNTVSNAALSATGKASFPSGALAAVFHCSVPHEGQATDHKVNLLEQLLVYTPSGHIVQYKLLSSLGGEASEAGSSGHPGSLMHVQDEDLRVKVEAVQGWDVCRRTDWPEREENILGLAFSRQQAVEIIMDSSDYKDNDPGHRGSVKAHDHSHLYLSNAEVQINSGRIPAWQNVKVYFYTMSSVGTDRQNVIEDHTGGETEIERVPVHEVEIRRKDLMPVFDHFHRSRSDLPDRALVREKHLIPSSDYPGSKEFSGDANISDYKLGSPSSIQNLAGGSQRIGPGKGISGLQSPIYTQISFNQGSHLISLKKSSSGVPPVEDINFSRSLSSSAGGSFSDGRTLIKEVQSSNSGGTSEVSNTSSNRSDLSMNILDDGPVNDSLDFEQFFQEGYCKASALSECPRSTEEVSNGDCTSSPCDREKCEDSDDDNMLGGVFAFSEEC